MQIQTHTRNINRKAKRHHRNKYSFKEIKKNKSQFYSYETISTNPNHDESRKQSNLCAAARMYAKNNGNKIVFSTTRVKGGILLYRLA